MTRLRRKHTPDKRINFTDQQDFPPLWLLGQDLRTFARLDRLMAKEGLLGARNSDELDLREHEIRFSTNNWDRGNFTLPDDFPLVRLALTHTDFAPDYVSIGPHSFCSRRLRDVLALPQDVAQFLAVDLIAGGEQVQAQDYRKMHVLAQRPALDLERSGCVMKEVTHQVTGRTILLIDTMERVALLERLQAEADIFLVSQAPYLTLVTDALAARVLQSGCTGMEFSDPANPLPITGMRIERYRTKTGIAERRIGFLD